MSYATLFPNSSTNLKPQQITNFSGRGGLASQVASELLARLDWSTNIWVALSNAFGQVNFPYTTNFGGLVNLLVGGNATTITGNTSSGSNSITNVNSTLLLGVGYSISGTGIPSSTTITAINSSTSITISNNATITNTSSTFTITSPQTLYKVLGSYQQSYSKPYSGIFNSSFNFTTGLTINDAENALTILGTGQSINPYLSYIATTTPNTFAVGNWELITNFSCIIPSSSMRAGLFLSDGTKFLVFGYTNTSNNAPFQAQGYLTRTSDGFNLNSNFINPSPQNIWIKIFQASNGGNFTIYCSLNGIDWITVVTNSLSGYLSLNSPTCYCGFCMDLNYSSSISSTVTSAFLQVNSWLTQTGGP